MKKAVIILITTAVIIILVLSSLVVLAKNDNQDTKLADKVTQEIKYLDQYLVSLLGDFNGITIGNYLKEELSNLKLELEDKNKESDATTSKEENSEESNESTTSNGQNSNSIKSNTQINILANNGDYKAKWSLIQSQIEELYQTWNTISIDLNSINVDASSILAFGDFLNISTQNIKKKDKEKAMDSIVKMYQLLPKYSESYKPNTKETNVLNIQKNIVTAYVDVSNNKWQDAQSNISEASKQFTNLLNTVKQNFNNQTIVNQCYILTNELNKAIKLKDKEIFFIEYQNLMSKMGII